MHPVSIEILHKKEDFEGLESSWNRLLERSGFNDFFLTFRWMYLYWQYFHRSSNLFLIVLKKRSTIVGILPLVKRKIGFFHGLEFLGERLSDYQDFILDDRYREESLAAVENILNNEKYKWDFCRFSKLSENSPNIEFIKNLIRWDRGRTYFECIDVSPYIPITDSWPDYKKGIRKSLLQDTERQIRRLSAIGNVQYQSYKDETEIKKIFNLFIKLKSNRIYSDGREANNPFGSTSGKDFFLDLPDKIGVGNILDASSLNVGGEVAAIHIGFKHNNKYYYYMPSFNKKYVAYSVGRVLMMKLIQTSFEEKMDEFDFLNGGEQFKYEWNARNRKIFRKTIYPNRMKSALLQSALNIRKRMAGLRAKNGLPVTGNLYKLRDSEKNMERR